MNEARSVRDSCLSAFVAAVVGIVGLVAVINWDSSIKQQKVAFAATVVLCIGAVAALVVASVQHRHIKRTRTKSAYARLMETVAGHFGIMDEVSGSKSPLRRFFQRFRLG
jgi:drug/metabolite transporter (DMT)-like permease